MVNQDPQLRTGRPGLRTNARDTAGTSRDARRPTRMERREGRMGYLLIAPTTALLTVFYLWPVVQTIGYSFTNWNSATGSIGGIVGIQNFRTLLDDQEFTRALLTTGIYIIFVVPATMTIGLVLAALLAQPFRGRGIYRALLFVPYIAPIVGSALIFTYILSPLGGIVNGVLTSLGVAPVGFLATEPWALVSVIVFSSWQGVGYAMVIYAAGLSGIPPSYYEAARIDGASAWRRFFSISVPLVAPTTAFLAVTGVISALQVFTQVYVLTQGGPLGSTETLLYYIYKQGFVYFHGGLASAAAVILLIIGIGISIIQLRFINRSDAVELE